MGWAQYAIPSPGTIRAESPPVTLGLDAPVSRNPLRRVGPGGRPHDPWVPGWGETGITVERPSYHKIFDL